MKKFILLCLACQVALNLTATHIRGGEITYAKTGTFTYTFQVTLYSDDASSADSPFVLLNMGDGTPLVTTNRISKVPLAGGYSKALYAIVSHTFPTTGIYKISLTEQNRQALTNVPNSSTQPFYVETTIEINPSIGANALSTAGNSILKAIANQPFYANLTTYSSVSTDSLSFQLFPIWKTSGQALEGYQYPAGLTVNSVSGEIVWANPTQAGIFGLAVRVSLWRNGVKIATMHRDFAIVVADGAMGGKMPTIGSFSSINFTNPYGTQVEAGQSIVFRVMVDKTNPVTDLQLISHLFTATPYDSLNFRVIKFEWTPTLAQKQKPPYILTFRSSGIVEIDKTILLYVGYPPATPTFITANEQSIDERYTITLFPNPAQEVIHFDFDRELHAVLFIYNAEGKEVLQTPIAARKITLPVATFDKGVYHYKVMRHHTQVGAGKFVKN